MKKYSRFKQAYKAVLDDIIDENVYPSTRNHLRKQIAYAFGLGAMWEWSNDVMPFFKGVAPTEVEGYLKKAYDLGFITLNANNPLCMYPTQKLMSLN